MTYLGYAIGIVLSYLIGTIIWGYIFGRLGGIDIRRWGSGNVGATNVARILGWKRGVVCLVLDVLKGVVAVGLVGRLMGGRMGTEPELFMVFSAVAVIAGHIFPPWLKFKGGKGVATALGAWLVLAPVATLIALGVFVAVAAAWRYVSLGSIIAAAVLPMSVYLMREHTSKLVFAIVLGALVIVRHIGNIKRLVKGTESKLGAKKSTKISAAPENASDNQAEPSKS